MTIIFRENFDRQMVKLGSIFGFLREETLDDYYEIFKNKDEDYLDRAVSWLIEHHDIRKFPLPAEIIDAIKEIYNQDRSWELKEEKTCEKCSGNGMVLADKDNLVQYCECPAGVRRAKGHEQYFKNRVKWRKQNGEADNRNY
jgi:predicted methyltransferase